ncbi:hypothetical protein VIBNISOn1_530016 [Vibrio nigripulchritudo SOn1]|uniref:Uncharacterized protein n=1 Tax=Vibrio nigripulchritudo SOn1 TaxID=1238450 RepID=A0AAV2VV03_9VIBR|nr:hypothetical protein [Vibrio nigripulchritudo]CCO48447.1 hypothetical protein VIBNISOn1_530016 [Vibrio nigripulchritudo SOn1]
MSKVHLIDPKNKNNLSDYANAVGKLSLICVASTETLRSFLTNHYGVNLEQLSTLHNQYFARPINLDDNDDINSAIDRVLERCANKNVSVKEALKLLFPNCSNDAVCSYSEHETINAYQTVCVDQQIDFMRKAESENWALCRG